MASEVVDRAAVDPAAGISRADVILTLFNSFVCTDALVLVRLHQTSHSHYFSANNDAVVSRIRMGLLPRVRTTVYDVECCESCDEIKKRDNGSQLGHGING